MQLLVDSLFREKQQRVVIEVAPYGPEWISADCSDAAEIYQVGEHHQTVEKTPDKIGHAPNRQPGERGALFRRVARCGSSPC